MADDDEKLRTDARANRDRILEVAREALVANPDASLHSIAKAAGVGQGTLYRHFATREALVLGVYRHEIDALAELGSSLLTKHPPLQAFRLWCDRLIKFGKMKHGVADLLLAARSGRDYQDAYRPMTDAVRKLMAACKDAGEISASADAEDFLIFLSFLWQISPTPVGEARVKRLLAVFFRGIAANDGR